LNVFLILSGTAEQYDKTIALISALGRIKSVGHASDLTEALGNIRQGYPNIPIFTSEICCDDMYAIMMSAVRSGYSIIILPREFVIGDKCAYISIEVDHGNPVAEWIINSVARIIQKYDVDRRKPRVQLGEVTLRP
jgi:hypothetical protein